MKVKKLVAGIAIAGILSMVGVAYAAAPLTPNDIVSGLTGKTSDELYSERSGGKTYGTIAEENGVLDEFKEKMIEQKKAVLDERVQTGQITQEQADDIYSRMKDNQANCDGTGSGKIGQQSGMGYGRGNRGYGMGNGGYCR